MISNNGTNKRQGSATQDKKKDVSKVEQYKQMLEKKINDVIFLILFKTLKSRLENSRMNNNRSMINDMDHSGLDYSNIGDKSGISNNDFGTAKGHNKRNDSMIKNVDSNRSLLSKIVFLPITLEYYF